ncbi:hypothetical protein FSP39_024282, partial [Pinctada imbricata]
ILTDTCVTIYDKGRFYRGSASTTEHGKACIDWDKHPYDVNPTRYPGEGLVTNYCRNPLGSGKKPWCYTMAMNDTTVLNKTDFWGFCDIPNCDPCFLRGIQFKNGDAFHNGCSQCVCVADGLRCYGCPTSPKSTNGTSVPFGCYKQSNPTAKFPACCERTICNKDPDFSFEEYTKYLKKVLTAR